jgi:hypothetical protein
MMRNRLVALAGLLVAAQLAACGGSSSLPDPAQCPLTTPLPTAVSRAPQGRSSYLAVLQDRINRLQDLWAAFKLAYPSNGFSPDEPFRPAVAKFIDDSTCIAFSIHELQATTPQLEQAKAQIDIALDAYVAHLKAGREAIRSRNATDYHAFWDGLDAKFEAVRTSFSRR